MLQQICEHIHNYFVKDAYPGQWRIADGTISPSSFLLDGQRFWITGSVFNDGVYTYHPCGITDDDDSKAVGLQPEEFAGTVCAMAVPPAVVALAGEINTWVESNSAALNSPYQSENVIGVYSYTKASGGSGAGGAISWQDVFRTRLDRWRKVCL